MIKARFIMEVVGSPAELVTKTLNNIVDSIKESFSVEDVYIDKPEKKGKNLFSCFVEIVINFDNIQSFFGFMLYYTPSVVEILEPYKLSISAGELENISNDIMSKIHELDKMLKTTIGVNKLLSKRVIPRNTGKKL